MQESKFYQLEKGIIIRETTIKHISTALKTKFSADVVNALTPIIQNISDVQRLKELYTAAVKAQNIKTFTQMLSE